MGLCSLVILSILHQRSEQEGVINGCKYSPHQNYSCDRCVSNSSQGLYTPHEPICYLFLPLFYQLTK